MVCFHTELSVYLQHNFEKTILHRGVEQLVARRAHNPKAVGSSPAPATKKSRMRIRLFCFISLL